MTEPHNSYKYHVEMMLSEARNLNRPGGDTRGYLSLDRGEQAIMIELLERELAAVNRTLSFAEFARTAATTFR